MTTTLYISLITVGVSAALLAVAGMALLVRIAVRSTVPVRRIEDLLPLAAQATVDASSRIVILPVRASQGDDLRAA